MDAGRLKSLVDYICTRCHDRARTLTISQLHRVLWYADGETYVRLGQAIIGDEYVRQLAGPVSVHLESVISELEREGQLETRSVQSSIEGDRELVPKGSSNISFLAGAEFHILEEVIRSFVREASESSSEPTRDSVWQVRDSGEFHSGLDLSSRLTPTWMAAAIGEPIPYQQQLLSRFPPLTKEDREWIASELKDPQ
jgi:Protein of unknown function (DUF4065)